MLLLLLLRCRGQRQDSPALLLQLLLHRRWVSENEPLEAAPIAICSNGVGRASNVQSNFGALATGARTARHDEAAAVVRQQAAMRHTPAIVTCHIGTPMQGPSLQPTLAAAGRAQQQPSVVEAGAKQGGSQLANAQVGARLQKRQMGEGAGDDLSFAICRL